MAVREWVAEGAGYAAAGIVGGLGLELGPLDIPVTMGTKHVVTQAAKKALGVAPPSMDA